MYGTHIDITQELIISNDCVTVIVKQKARPSDYAKSG